jgi:hypothetical protein
MTRRRPTRIRQSFAGNMGDYLPTTADRQRQANETIASLVATCDACGRPTPQGQMTPLPWYDQSGAPQTAMVCPSCAEEPRETVNATHGFTRRRF